jgi:hypothetical protein
MARYPLIIVTASIALLAMLPAISWAGPGGSGDDPIPIIRPLVGRTIPQVVEQLGHPFMVVPLRETGGKLMFFENSRGDRYIIETDGTGIVVDAAVKHPESR